MMFRRTRRFFLQLPIFESVAGFFQPLAAQATSVDQPAKTKPEVIAERMKLELRRGPYLQCQGPDRITIRWRTSRTAEPGVVRFGDDITRLNQIITAKPFENALHDGSDWVAEITGLEPSKKYYYALEHSKAILAGFDEEYHFQTAVETGKPSLSRFLVLGDSGTNRFNSGNPLKELLARHGFLKYNHGRNPPDGIILLGDNAYSHGTDEQYQNGLFSVYARELKSIPVWPCIGNHEISDDYLSIFSVPENGEMGGTASHSRHYYSFDFGNIHFTVLDLWKTEWRNENTAQIKWLKADLAATKQPWKVVINHFPPYCDGKYESDNNSFLVEVRQKIMPMLENAGADLFLTGHDHTYQRSWLLDGHYGLRSTFDPAMHRKSDSDGIREPIIKKSGPNSGMITVVTGTAGGEQPADLNNPNSPQLAHPAMVPLAKGDQAGRGIRKIGTFLLEIEGEKLAGIQIDEKGEELDRFTMIKNA
jgi:predicted MPP superfamily phosphohydrolase